MIQGMERPPSGVWAVRAAQPLARNLEQISRGQTPQPWRPQRRALQLLGLTIGTRREAWLLWGNTCLGPLSLALALETTARSEHLSGPSPTPVPAMSRSIPAIPNKPTPWPAVAAPPSCPPIPFNKPSAAAKAKSAGEFEPEDAHSLGTSSKRRPQCTGLCRRLPCPDQRSLAERPAHHPARLLRSLGQRRPGLHRPSHRDHAS